MEFQGGFDAAGQKEFRAGSLLSEGDHLAVIDTSEEKENSKKTGSFLKLTFQMVDGPDKNRLHWVNLNLDNPSDDAVNIAKAELGAICKAVNVLKPINSQELHGIPLVLRIKHRKKRKSNDIEAKIVAYLPRDKWNGAGEAKPDGVPF